jgi:hypothetical protein
MLINFNDYISPFQNINQLYVGLYIVIKLKHWDNTSMINCIKLLTNIDLSIYMLNLFIGRINLMKNLYPVDAIESLVSLNESIHTYCINNDLCLYHFKPSINNCLSCKADLTLARKSDTQSMVYFCDNVPVKCLNTSFRCELCNVEYFNSYYVKSNKKRVFSETVLNGKYISFTSQTYFERKIFDVITAELVHKHSTFLGIQNTYNSVFQNLVNEKRGDIEIKRIIECFFYYHLLKFKNEYSNLNDCEFEQIDSIDIELSAIKPQLFVNFVQKWNNKLHFTNCKDKDCSKALVLDGNHKVSRLQCIYDLGVLKSSELNDIPIGCIKSPVKESLFCNLHDKKHAKLHFLINNSIVEIDHSSITASKCKDAICIHDCYRKVKKNSKKDEDDELLYLTEVNSSERKYLWVREEDVPAEMLREFQEKYNSRLQVALNNGVSCYSNVDFKQFIGFKEQTVGVLISIYNCGVVSGYREIFGSESLSQASLFLMDLIDECNIIKQKLPEFFIYDRGCQLAKFILNQDLANKSNRGKVLASKRFYVDKLHFKGHTDAYCKLNHNPYVIKELDNINTMACEQFNRWFSRFKYSMMQMSFYNYHFFLYIILDNYNYSKLKLRSDKFR